jgi:SPP1 gp7 family putative phage head morphogenesis protein
MSIILRSPIVNTSSVINTNVLKNKFPIYEGTKPLSLTEQLKGEIEAQIIKFPSMLGEEHPFDFMLVEKAYKEIGLVKAVIDKYIDFMISGGFYVYSKDARAQEIIEQWMKDVNFDSVLREWMVEALTKGNGFLEISADKNSGINEVKVLNANNIFVVRDIKGRVDGYNQYNGNSKTFNKSKVINFKTNEIAHISINKISGEAYGLGLIYTALKTLDYLAQSDKDSHELLSRKANAPLHIKVGQFPDNIPSDEVISAIGAKVEHMTNKDEWVTGPDYEFKAVDFGQIGEKFTAVVESDLDRLFFTFQVPEVLMGRSVNLAVAPVQIDAFERRVLSLRAEAEPVIENKVFKRILNANGIDAFVEFGWGQPSNSQLNEKIAQLTNMLQVAQLSPQLRAMLEKELVEYLELDVKELETTEEERKEEENKKQPIIPGSNQEHTHDYITEDFEKDYKLREWLNFNFNDYVNSILQVIKTDNFENLAAKNKNDELIGKLSEGQIKTLKNVFSDGFKQGKSVKTIAKEILNKTGLRDLYKSENGEIVLNDKLEPIVQVDKKMRANLIARTETTRLASQGALEQYKTHDINSVAWVAAFSDRTCPICEANNNKIYSVNEAVGLIPAHTMCRCTWRAVVG